MLQFLGLVVLLGAQQPSKSTYEQVLEATSASRQAVEIWGPGVVGTHLMLSRNPEVHSSVPAKVVSLAEMATSSGSAALRYNVRDGLHVSTLDGRGVASINIASGQVKEASGTLAPLRGLTLERVKRTPGKRAFFLPDGTDFLVPLSAVKRLFGLPHEKSVYVLPLYPRIANASDDIRFEEGTKAQQLRFSSASVRKGELEVGVRSPTVVRYELDGQVQFWLYYGGAFKNHGRAPLLVQTGLLLPLADGMLKNEAPVGFPLGRGMRTRDRSHFQGFSGVMMGPEYGPTAILSPGQEGLFTDVAVRLSWTKAFVPAEDPLVFRYEDGKTQLTISVKVVQEG